IVGDIARLRRLVLGADEVREFGGFLLRIKGLGESLAGPGDNRVRGGEDRLRRSIIAFERDDRGRRRNAARKVEDVAYCRGAKRIDRLRVVADDGEPGPVRTQRQQDLGLEPVGVLILVDENVVEASAYFGSDGRLGHRVTPVQEEIVVIEYVVLLLPCDISLKEATEFAGPLVTPWKKPGEGFFERTAGVDGVRVDRQAGVLTGEARRGLRQAEFAA